jgi:O-antigen/teichoic acid export membrane protein
VCTTEGHLDRSAGTDGDTAAGVLRTLRQDLLLQNSLFIMASTATMGALGFAFWVLCARLFDAQAVGVASSLVTAASLISYLALLGFNTTLIAFMPRAAEPDREVSTGLNLVVIVAVAVSLVYVAGAPLFAGELSVLHASALHVIGFVVLTAATAANLLTDSFFLAYRSARFNFLVDGIVQSSVKLALLVGVGAFGVFASSGLAAVAATGLSLTLMVRRFHYRYRPVIDLGILRATLGYSASSYVSSLLNLVPQLVLPLVVLRARGGAETGFYYVAFQISMLANGISFAIGQSLFAEGSQRGADLGLLARRTARLNLAVLVPCVGACIVATPYVLAPFGADYVARASGPLIWFALGCPAVALNVWASALLRLRQRMGLLVWSNVAFVVATCGLGLWLAPGGAVGVAVAWLAGNLLAGLIALIGFLTSDRAAPGAAEGPGAADDRRRRERAS